MRPEQPPGPPTTLGELRWLDARSLLILIQDDDGKPKLALCYKTQKEADDAATHADQCWQTRYFLPERAMRPIVPKESVDFRTSDLYAQ
jgi:hypothetical protein